MPPPTIILASSSRYRRALLARLAIAFECDAADFDEEAEKERIGPVAPEVLVGSLARAKALHVSRRRPDAVVIGGDQTAELDGTIFGKPGDHARTVAQLERLSGRTHRLLTALAIVHGASGRMAEALDVHSLTMRTLSHEAIERYIRHDKPYDCAGGYRIESLGIALFERICGDDGTAIEGLPLTRLVMLLEPFGVCVP